MSNAQATVFVVFTLVSSARVLTAEGFRQGVRFAIEACVINLLVIVLIYSGGKW